MKDCDSERNRLKAAALGAEITQAGFLKVNRRTAAGGGGLGHSYPINRFQSLEVLKNASRPSLALHWARNTRFRSVMKLGTLYTTQMASMPFSAAYWAGDIR